MTERPIRALIVDDEPKARRAIRILLGRDPEIEVVAEAGTVDEAVARIEEHEPDLLYLDVQMPGPDGFETLSRIDPERVPWTIFVTAYEEYALQAFESDAVDYLLKPYNDERFEQALERAKRQIRFERSDGIRRRIADLVAEGADRPSEGDGTEERYADRFVIKESGRIFFVEIDRVRWIEAEGHYVRLHTDDGDHLVRAALSDVADRLDPAHFVRIHRSTIVCLDAVKEFALWDKGHYVAVMESGDRLRVSRSGFERLQERLGNRL